MPAETIASTAKQKALATMDPDLIDSGTPNDTGSASGATENEPSLEDQLNEAIGLTEEGDGDAQGDEATEGTDAAAGAKPGEAAAGAEGTAPATAAPGAAVDPKAKDAELYAPLPEHNPRKTHERFAKLVDGHKAAVTERDAVIGERDQLAQRVQQHEDGWKAFQDMGFVGEAAVQDLSQFSTYRNALSKGDWATAGQVIQAQARQLALLSGQRLDVNPLAGFQDLETRVQGGELDEPTALELARNRHQAQLQQQNAQRQQAQTQQVGQQNQAIQQGLLATEQMAIQLSKDPDFAKIEPEVLKQLPHIRATYPPHLWPGEVRRAYETERRILALQANQRTGASPQPLRGNGHSSGKAAPATMQEAALQALGLA